MKITRYAIYCKNSGAFFCQGSPLKTSDSGFEFAILYATVEHAERAIKKNFRYGRNHLVVLPVTTEVHIPQFKD